MRRLRTLCVSTSGSRPAFSLRLVSRSRSVQVVGLKFSHEFMVGYMAELTGSTVDDVFKHIVILKFMEEFLCVPIVPDLGDLKNYG